MDNTNADEPVHYSQETAAAMHGELRRRQERIGQLEKLVGILNREAETQAATIEELREEIGRWQSRYINAVAPADHQAGEGEPTKKD